MARAAEQQAPEALGSGFAGFHGLLPHRVQEVLLVCSMYESFILEEDGLIADLISSEYLELNLSHAPRVWRASTGQEALSLIRGREFDLVITMTRLADWDVGAFAQAVKQVRPELRVVVLADEPRELARYSTLRDRGAVERVFVWNGDAKILLAIIKYVEDRLNAEHDAAAGNVRVIILVENSVRFYSSYLPLIYTELMKQTQRLMSDGINRVHKLLRMRARPKILLAETFEEARDLYTRFSENLLGIISDVRFPRDGRLDLRAGLEFARRVKSVTPHMPVLLQSSDAGYAAEAQMLGATFIHKKSRALHQELRNFILGNLGFGDFVFRLPDGTEVGRSSDVRSLVESLRRVPDDSIAFHASNNHFSNWLMARTEFEVAARIKPRKVSDFESVTGLREYLIETLSDSYEKSQTGVIVDFARHKFDAAVTFARIGGGSIGGKARGLAFINALLKRYNPQSRFPDVRVAVPLSAAIATGVFDAFLDDNNLHRWVVEDHDDEAIIRAFQAGRLPPAVQTDLAAFLGSVRDPLAVRSSSLLEDSHGQPFAGIYRTYMLPNNHYNLGVRLDQLCSAVKLVYASTFLRSARRYLEATGHHVEDEKMGVIVQELVGSPHRGRFYPTFSGVARSYNYYPCGKLTPEDGVACVALGLGKMVVEGGEALMFSPAHPGILPQFSSPRDLLAHSQRSFFALDTGQPDAPLASDADSNLRRFGLDTAEQDGALGLIGSVYSPSDDAVFDGIGRPGPRLVTFAHVLKSNVFPLAEILKYLLDVGRRGMACPVEIEFAVNLDAEPREFGFLQIRPITADQDFEEVPLEFARHPNTVCFSSQAMGNGMIRGILDIVFVRPDQFTPARTRDIAAELGQLNEKLRAAGRTFLLIGPGRWGSADPWLGIPVQWEQISSAQAIVETCLNDFVVTPSQGTHFFQNLTSFRVGYFTVNPEAGEGFVNWEWLMAMSPVEETRFLRHVRLPEPMEIRLDGRTRRGIILAPPP